MVDAVEEMRLYADCRRYTLLVHERLNSLNHAPGLELISVG